MRIDFVRSLQSVTHPLKTIQIKRMTTRSHSPPTSDSNDYEPLTKRMRMTSPSTSINPIASTSKLPYDKGLHLAPMVRIGTLPTRLLGELLFFSMFTFFFSKLMLTCFFPWIIALEYGAELVWGPEIVAQAIIGSTRVVDRKF